VRIKYRVQRRIYIPDQPDDAQWWISTRREKAQSALKRLREAQGEEKMDLVPEDQVIGAIRLVQEDGTDVCIGSLGVHRCTWLELMKPGVVDWENRDQLTKENEQRRLGDPEIIWAIGCEYELSMAASFIMLVDYLNPAYHGKGIMVDAVRTAMTEWAIPRMKVRRMLGCAYVGNEASLKVQLKFGFTHRETIERYKESKGRMRDVYVLDWSLPGE
jgi:RimJ/RimL family protein N-acetyltransferase